MISSIRQWANTVKTYSARHSGGQTLVLTALMLTTFIGFVGLAADTGYFFDYRRRMTAAADDRRRRRPMASHMARTISP